MYKIYINGTPFHLAATHEVEDYMQKEERIFVAAYPGRAMHLLNYVDMLEKSDRFDAVYIHHHNYAELKAHWKQVTQDVKAAGGLVVNELGEILFIYRRGHWDLPKGKMEAGESKRETAVREVEEETGITGLKIVRKLRKTKHLFRDKQGKRRVKKAYWYFMRCRKADLVPQTEEDITEAVWMTYEEWLTKTEPTYSNIRLLLNENQRFFTPD